MSACGMRWALACSYAVFSLTLVTLRYAIPGAVLRIPLGVILAELLLSFTGAAAARVARRILYERIVARNLTRRKAVAVLLIGAGRSGVNAANQLRVAGNLRPVGFLDDDPKKTGLLVAGLKVLGTVSLLSSLVPKYRVEQVILCIPSPPRELLRRIWAACELLGVNVKIVRLSKRYWGERSTPPTSEILR